MTDAPWFPLFVSDWLTETRDLTHEMRGVHADLLCLAWKQDGLPTDPEAIRKLAQCSPKTWAKVWPDLSAKWMERDGRLVNARQEAERVVTGDISQKRREAGRKGAAAKWQTHGKRSDCQMANDGHTHNNTVQNTTTERELTLSLVARAPSPAIGAIELSPGQLQAAVPWLVGAWNNLCALDGSPFKPVTVRSHPKATQALRAHPDIDWWVALFQRVAASDFLRRDAKMAPADLWWVLDHVEEIAAGRYDNRAVQSKTAAALAEVLRDLA